MGTRALIYVNNKFLCLTWYDSFPSKLGMSLNRVSTDWRQILLVCKDFSIVNIETEILLKEPLFTYECLDKNQRGDLKGLTQEILEDLNRNDGYYEKGGWYNGGYDDITMRYPSELYKVPIDMDETFQYNHVQNKVFVRYGVTNFPWIPLEDLEYHDSKLLDDILFEMCGFIDDSDYSYKTKEKVRTNGPINSGRQFILACKKQTQNMPNNPNSWWNYGVSLEKLGKFNEAIGSYLQAIKQTPENSIIWRYLAEAYEKRGDEANSIDALKKTIKSLEKLDYYEELKNQGILISEILKRSQFKELSDLFYSTLLQQYKHFEQLLSDKELNRDQRISQRHLWELLGETYYHLDRRNESLQAFGRALNIHFGDVKDLYYRNRIDYFIKDFKKYGDVQLLREIYDLILEHLIKKYNYYKSTPKEIGIWRSFAHYYYELKNDNLSFKRFNECLSNFKSSVDKQKIQKNTIFEYLEKAGFGDIISRLLKI